MMYFIGNWLPSTFSTLTNAPPLLPDPGVVKIWLALGWSVVLAAAGWIFASMLFKAAPTVLARHAKGCSALFAAMLAIWCWLPGANGASFWLGLAFQSPSLTTVVCCSAVLWGNVGTNFLALRESGNDGRNAGVLGGVVLGWILLLDTLGFWPGSVYGWGFHAAAAPIAVLVAGLLWVVGGARCTRVPCILVLGGAVLFVTLRLPTGNLWDALLDPLLWVALNLWGGRGLWHQYRLARRSKRLD